MSHKFDVEEFLLDFEDRYYAGPWIDAPLVHKVHRVDVYLAEVLKASKRCLAVDAEIPAVITVLAAVDYLAGFYAGRESNRHDYPEFMAQYFPDSYKSFLKRIYSDLRCGLMHNLVAVSPWQPSQGSFLLVTDVPNHLAIENGKVIWSINTFIVHTYEAWVKYQYHLIMDGPQNKQAVHRFHQRFDRLAGTGAFMEKAPDSERRVS